MGHDHHHHHHAEGKIKSAFFLNFFFTILEIVGGIWTNSMAILADALHDLGDSLSLGLAWYFEKKAKKGRDTTYSYGYKRYSTLAAFINSIVLVSGSAIILYETLPRLWNPQPTNANGMIGLAIIGVLVNGIAVLRLRKGTSLNERVVSLHLLEDVLGWAAVLVGALIMYFTQWYIMDPLLSVGITIFVLYNATRNIKATFKVFMQAVPQELSEERLREMMTKYPEIKDVHDIHIWSLDGTYQILSFHITLKEDMKLQESMKLKQQIRNALEEKHNIHLTIEIDHPNEHCKMQDC